MYAEILSLSGRDNRANTVSVWKAAVLPEWIAEVEHDRVVTLPSVSTVHFNLEMTIVASACCKSTNCKDLPHESKQLAVLMCLQSLNS